MPIQALDSGGLVAAAFAQFRDELDDANDRRERLIKASRDITALSKKAIFLLHRLAADPARAAAAARPKLAEIQALFARLKSELVGGLFWRHARAVSGGTQEYIEALAFAHYLEHGTLVSFDEVQRSLSDEDGVPYFPLTAADYLLGLSDLTGELMRYAISAIPRKGGRAKAAEVCAFVRACKADFEAYVPYFRKDLQKKQGVTASSLQKIEDAVYAITIRTAEYDLPPEVMEDLVARLVSGITLGPTRRQDRQRDEVEDGEEEEHR